MKKDITEIVGILASGSIEKGSEIHRIDGCRWTFVKQTCGSAASVLLGLCDCVIYYVVMYKSR